MRSLTYMAVAAGLAAAACGNETVAPDDGAGTPQQVQVGDTVRLQYGGVARIGASGVLVAFRRVEADSRCPIDALCVWPGDAAVRLELTSNPPNWSAAIVHSFLDPRSVEFGGFVFKLVEVAPAPVSTETRRPQDYSIALEVRSR